MLSSASAPPFDAQPRPFLLWDQCANRVSSHCHAIMGSNRCCGFGNSARVLGNEMVKPFGQVYAIGSDKPL